MRTAAVLLLAIGTVLLVSCGPGDETPSPSPTASASPSATRTHRPAATTTPAGGTISLAEALGSQTEVLAPQPLAESTLYYAVKEGTHVRVLRRDIVTGNEALILEYDEPHKADHDGNHWNEQVPSVGLDRANGRLVYASDPDLKSYDLDSGAVRTLLSQVPGDTGEMSTRRWTTASGQELCCAYTLASISVGPRGRATVQMSQWEGADLASFATDGSDVCIVEDAAGDAAPTGGANWNSSGELAAANWGAYVIPGLYIASPDNPCLTRELAHDLMAQNNSVGFDDATWSADDQWIATTLRSGYEAGFGVQVVLVSHDDATRVTLVPDGINASPLFSRDGSLVYYARAEAPVQEGVITKWRMWTVNVASRSAQEWIDLPPRWSAKPTGWTKEGYLMLRLTSEGPWSAYGSRECRLAIIEPVTGKVIYISKQQDFTDYLALMP